MRLKARNDIHLARRAWHFCGVMTIFSLYFALPPLVGKRTAIIAAFILVGFDIARLYLPKLNQFFMRLFGPFLRQGEEARVSGVTAMMVGVTMIIWFFSREVVLLSLLFVAIGDPAASYFGVRYGRDKLIGQKSLQGSLAAFMACFGISLVYFLAMNLMTDRLFIACLLGGLIGAVSELLPIARLDDNVVFPIVSATLLQGMFYLFGGFA